MAAAPAAAVGAVVAEGLMVAALDEVVRPPAGAEVAAEEGERAVRGPGGGGKVSQAAAAVPVAMVD